jgi:hypothetical protein
MLCRGTLNVQTKQSSRLGTRSSTREAMPCLTRLGELGSCFEASVLLLLLAQLLCRNALHAVVTAAVAAADPHSP